MLTVEDIQAAIADPSVRLVGRVTGEVLMSFVEATGGCAFSEAMAEGTDSWINAASVFFADGFLKLDHSGISNFDEAVLDLRGRLTLEVINGLVYDYEDKNAREPEPYEKAHGVRRVPSIALELDKVTINL
ncbi:MAG: hypothetical protein HZB09_00920 [Candidatus Yonathbacteria bacterium]|nr:hypothetical protein [Candidatus Yonathbacteria bacterium]